MRMHSSRPYGVVESKTKAVQSSSIHCRSLTSPCPFAAAPGGTLQSPSPRSFRTAASAPGDTQRRTGSPSTRTKGQATEPGRGCRAMPEPVPRIYRVRQIAPASTRCEYPQPSSLRSFRSFRGDSFRMLQSRSPAARAGPLPRVLGVCRRWSR